MKLDDIPKKQPFTVPDGYFEQLSEKVQKRISSQTRKETAFVFRYKLQYVVPAILMLLAIIVLLVKPKPTEEVESMLASVDTEQLVAYLNNSELTTEDLIEEVKFSAGDIEKIESEVYQLRIEDESLDALLDELD